MGSVLSVVNVIITVVISPITSGLCFIILAGCSIAGIVYESYDRYDAYKTMSKYRNNKVVELDQGTNCYDNFIKGCQNIIKEIGVFTVDDENNFIPIAEMKIAMIDNTGSKIKFTCICGREGVTIFSMDRLFILEALMSDSEPKFILESSQPTY